MRLSFRCSCPPLDFFSRTVGQRILVANASTDDELEVAFDSLVRGGVSALLVTADPYFDVRRDRIGAFAARQRLPAIHQFPGICGC